MRIALVLTPLDAENLQLARQIGVQDIVYYNMKTMPNDFVELLHLRTWVEDHGMKLSVVEGGPPNNDIVLGKSGRDAEMENYKRCIEEMGRAGVKILCYNFMPNSLKVVRTSYMASERGGSFTSSFSAQMFKDAPTSPDAPTNDEQMWENLEWFLKRIVPVCEQFEVKLAMHPDDPPISPMCGLSRIMRSPDNFQRLIDTVKSPSNGMTFCQGCFTEMGTDIPAMIKRFAKNIHFVHFRDITPGSSLENFTEAWHDAGKTDMAAAMKAYKDVGYAGPMRPDHVPMMVGETGKATGYTMKGRLFAVGYMRGIMHAIGAR